MHKRPPHVVIIDYGSGNLRSAGKAFERVAEGKARIEVTDDPGALAVARQLVTDAGYEPVVVGDLSTAKKFDAGSPVYPKAMLASDMRAALGLK